MTSAANRFASALDVPFWISVQSGEKEGAGYAALRIFLAFAAACYAAGLSVYLAAERIGLRRRAALPIPVISIGNITSGGTGKTPVTQMIAGALQERGLRPAILSRGYGGRLSRAGGQVSDLSGTLLLGAGDAGDEALALAKQVPGVPVFIGKDRAASGQRAIDACHPELFLLDDGLQYWQLKRNLDVVLLDSRKPFDNGYPLPRGALREPKRNLRRAGLIIITRSDRIGMQELEILEAEVRRLAPGVPVFRASHRISGLKPLNQAATRAAGQPLTPAAACGIAQPEAFLASLQASGLSVTQHRFVALNDHAAFDSAEIERINRTLFHTGADALIVTEKDAVKLDAACFDIPAYAAELRVQVENLPEFWRQLWRLAGLSEAFAAAAHRHEAVV